QGVGDRLDSLVDPALERHRAGAGGDVAQALLDQGLRQDGGGGGAVARDVVGLLGDLLDELGADLLVRIVEFDLLGDGDAVVGDGGGAPGLLEHDVASLGAEGHLDGIGELVHTLLEAAPGFLVVRDELGHCGISPVWCVSTRPTCPRRTKPHAACMSRGAGSLTGPECMWSAERRAAPRSGTRASNGAARRRCHCGTTRAISSYSLSVGECLRFSVRGWAISPCPPRRLRRGLRRRVWRARRRCCGSCAGRTSAPRRRRSAR